MSKISRAIVESGAFPTITTIATVNVFVEDQDRAKAIYIEPQAQTWGSFGMLVDSEGNQIVLGQRD